MSRDRGQQCKFKICNVQKFHFPHWLLSTLLYLLPNYAAIMDLHARPLFYRNEPVSALVFLTLWYYVHLL